MLFSDYFLLVSDVFFIALIFITFKSRQVIPPSAPKILSILFPLASIYPAYQIWVALNSDLFAIVEITFRFGIKKTHNISLIISHSITFVFFWVGAWRIWQDSKQSEKWIFIERGKWF